jgi:membrane-bound lytic murein transglycosylase A
VSSERARMSPMKPVFLNLQTTRWPLMGLLALAASVGMLGGCATSPTQPTGPALPNPPVISATPTAASNARLPLGPVIETDAGRLVPVDWKELVDFDNDPLDDVFKAFRMSCNYLGKQLAWQSTCTQLGTLSPKDQLSLRALLKTMRPHRVEFKDGKQTGTVTGYYEPVLRGSRTLRNPYIFPLYHQPIDLVTSSIKVGPTSFGRARKIGNQLVPYWSRAQMAGGEGQRSMSGREIVWVDDPMDVVLIEIQGSGRVMLPNGKGIRLNYAEHNGHPFRPLGQWFREKGIDGNASMLEIRKWARSNPPAKVNEMIFSNPQVVFFKWEPIPDLTVGPRGAAGQPLVPMRSIAVDPKSIPLAAPVWIDFKSPISDVQYRRLVFAQDTGGAIKGAVRADYFWGFGQHALDMAAKTKNDNGRMWVLLPPAS